MQRRRKEQSGRVSEGGRVEFHSCDFFEGGKPKPAAPTFAPTPKRSDDGQWRRRGAGRGDNDKTEMDPTT